MAKRSSLEELVHEASDGDGVERATVAVDIHVPFEVALAVLEDEDELRLGVNDIVEPDNVNVLEFLHERDLPYRGRRRALLRIEVYFLQRNNLIRCPRSPLGVPQFPLIRAKVVRNSL